MLLTNYGERVGKPDFGANLNALLSERLSVEDWNSRAGTAIRTTTQKYMSYVTINAIDVKVLSALNDGFSRVLIALTYSIPALSVQNRRLELTLTNLS